MENSINFLNASFLVKERTNYKRWTLSYLSAKKVLENLCFISVNPRIHELWAFVYITSKWFYIHDTYPVIDSPVYGKYDGENCSSMPQSIGKLQPFLWVPIIILSQKHLCCKKKARPRKCKLLSNLKMWYHGEAKKKATPARLHM